MKLELQTEDLDLIARRTVDLLRPYLQGKQQEDILDVQGLCDYLKVSTKWVYEQTHLRTIPFLKLGNKQLRFKKSQIDAWLTGLRSPAAGEPTGKDKLIMR
jgi:excisionase family DNA binding protein